jgi:hypothetical protein
MAIAPRPDAAASTPPSAANATEVVRRVRKRVLKAATKRFIIRCPLNVG